MILAGLALLAGFLPAAGSIYGHVSFVDNGAAILHEDGSQDDAVVNMPIIPGDTVLTSGGRCELQFDNGTVVRLDKGSRLRIATVLAPSLTSSWQITTLELEKGQMYALPQSYRREMFQVTTPNAAASLKSQVRATIRLDADGGTSFFSDGGKFQLLYGADARSLKKATVRSNKPLAVSAAHALSAGVAQRGLEFMAWNEYVDNHFQQLHRGISKVPPKLKFGNSALTHWAEKWSSQFGEWIYDELFGYVWRPADDRFAHGHRPFLHASFTRVDGQLFLIPQEAWGWVPAHMGTWVWMKRGWTWIPGDWFHSGCVDYSGLYSLGIGGHYYGFPTFDYLWNRWRWQWHGAMSRELHFRPGGELPVERPKKPMPAPLPDALLRLLRKFDQAPASIESKRLAIEKAERKIDAGQLAPVPAPRPQPAPTGPAPQADGPAGKAQPGKDVTRGAATDPTGGLFSLKRDWNPDRIWAQRRGHGIRYSSGGNAVVCPELKGASGDRRSFRRQGADPGRGGVYDLGGGITNTAAAPAPGTSSPGAAPGTAPGGQGGSGNERSGETKDDKGGK
jgi:hypothetical protein